MLPLDDPKWDKLQGGYRLPYNPSSALRNLESNVEIAAAWEELWTELHHQGDVGEASYAAVPHLVRIQRERGDLGWNLYALASVIEVERRRKGNPPLPEWLAESYYRSWRDLVEIGMAELNQEDDPLTIRCILGALALAKGAVKLGALISYLDESEIDVILEERCEWSRLYG
jgi:hypothetical protein